MNMDPMLLIYHLNMKYSLIYEKKNVLMGNPIQK